MLIVLHVLVALSGLVASGLAYWRPSASRLGVSYTLVGLTLASGTYLVVASHSGLVGACFSGLLYLAVTLTATILGQRKLAYQPTKDR